MPPMAMEGTANDMKLDIPPGRSHCVVIHFAWPIHCIITLCLVGFLFHPCSRCFQRTAVGGRRERCQETSAQETEDAGRAKLAAVDTRDAVGKTGRSRPETFTGENRV